MDEIKYHVRWREELVASSPEGRLIFEYTVGKDHVYFPDQDCWLKMAPEWARDKWSLYHETCQAWCLQNNVPFSLTSNALLFEEK